MKRIIRLFKSKRDSFNNIAVFVVCFYIFLSSIPSVIPGVIGNYETSSESLFWTFYKLIVFLLFVLFTMALFLINNMKIKIKYVVAALSYFLISCVLILLTKKYNITSVYSKDIIPLQIGLSTRMNSIFTIASTIYFLLIIIVVLPKVSSIRKQYKSIYLFIGLFAMICIFYFIGKNVILFFESPRTSFELDYASFFSTKNGFGKVLFVGCISFFLLYRNNNRNYIYLSLSFICVLFSLISKCKTSFVVSLLFYIVILVYKLYVFLTSKKKRKLFYIIISFIAGSILLMTLFLFVPSFRQKPFDRIYNVLSGILDSESMYDRFDIWIIYFNSLFFNVRAILFGYGDTISNLVLQAATSGASYEYLKHYSYHNGLLQVMASGGIIRLSLYVLITFFQCKKLIKDNNGFNHEYISMLISLFLYQLAESIVLFTSAYENFIISLLFITIPLARFQNRIDRKESLEIMEITI